MELNSVWAYDFDCDLSLDGMLRSFNAAGPWQWQLRDSAFYGDYLAAWTTDVSIRVHEFPQDTGWYRTQNPSGRKFTVTLKIDSSLKSLEIDNAIRGLLAKINATKIAPGEPTD